MTVRAPLAEVPGRRSTDFGSRSIFPRAGLNLEVLGARTAIRLRMPAGSQPDVAVNFYDDVETVLQRPVSFTVR